MERSNKSRSFMIQDIRVGAAWHLDGEMLALSAFLNRSNQFFESNRNHD
jgi:hypothetical protein